MQGALWHTALDSGDANGWESALAWATGKAASEADRVSGIHNSAMPHNEVALRLGREESFTAPQQTSESVGMRLVSRADRLSSPEAARVQNRI